MPVVGIFLRRSRNRIWELASVATRRTPNSATRRKGPAKHAAFHERACMHSVSAGKTRSMNTATGSFTHYNSAHVAPASAVAMTLSAGIRLGPYEIVSAVGAGGMG